MPSNDRLVIASNNANKIREIKAILGGMFSQILSMAEAGIVMDIEETGETFEENAVIKARAVAAAAGVRALADDSGICVDALGGRPGVHSARWSGGDDEANNQMLLKELEGRDNRRAHYACVMALAWPDGAVITAEGRCEGSIGFEPRGKRGFGYDPFFIVDGFGVMMAELPDEVKNGISHRRRALEALLQKMEELGSQ